MRFHEKLKKYIFFDLAKKMKNLRFFVKSKNVQGDEFESVKFETVITEWR